MLNLSEWFATKSEEAQSAAKFAFEHPLVLCAAIVFALGTGWLQWRLVWSGARKGMEGQTAGWDQSVTTSSRKTDVGHQTVLVMRPANKPLKIGLFGTLFFGGGAVFYWVFEMETPLLKEWLVFAIPAIGGLLGLLIMWMSTQRILLTDTTVEARALFRRPKLYAIASLQKITPVKGWEHGVLLHFNDGRQLRVRAMMTGYKDLLRRLEPYEPKLALISRFVQGARESRGKNARTTRS